ncbi:hypothetical protein [Dyella sp. C11]|uniref:hypothetical protein n=1 Tax=Dyella sp. C11 TaxID=2126991 RepID=UPI00130098D5|nr:hypothetical protein [Dyella sp. C11]
MSRRIGFSHLFLDNGHELIKPLKIPRYRISLAIRIYQKQEEHSLATASHFGRLDIVKPNLEMLKVVYLQSIIINSDLEGAYIHGRSQNTKLHWDRNDIYRIGPFEPHPLMREDSKNANWQQNR